MAVSMKSKDNDIGPLLDFLRTKLAVVSLRKLKITRDM